MLQIIVIKNHSGCRAESGLGRGAMPSLAREGRLCLASEKSHDCHEAHPDPEHRLVTCLAVGLLHTLSTFNTMHENLVGLEKSPAGMRNFWLLPWGWKHPWDSFAAV